MLESAEKPFKTYWTLSEIARELDEKPAQIRYWEQQMGGMGFQRKENATKRFNREEVDTFRQLHHLIRVELYSIEGACKQMREAPDRTANEEQKNRELKQTLEEMKKLLLFLKEKL